MHLSGQISFLSGVESVRSVPFQIWALSGPQMLAAHVAVHLLVIITLLSVIYWVRRSAEGDAARWLVRLLSVEVVWVLLLIAQLVAPEYNRSISMFARATGALTPAIWLVFIVHYTGRESWLTRVRSLVVGSVSGCIFLLLVTNPIHQFVLTFDVSEEPFRHLVGKPTLLQWMIYGVVYVFAIGGVFLLIDFILSSRHLSRAQTLTIVLGGTVAMGTNLMMPLRAGPVGGFDYSGIGTGLFGAAMGWALFNEQLFRVAPVARDSIFESFSDPLIAVDLDNAIVDFNAAACELFPEIETLAGEPIQTVEPALLAQDSDGFSRQFTTSIDGEERSYRIEPSPIDAGDRQVGVVLHLREVTELEAYAAKLERRTEQLELKTEQLEQFASSVSHDLRNPINVAQGRIQLTRETGELDHLDSAETALDRGLDTIEELLDLARSGQTISDPETVELQEILQDAWAAVDTREATLSTAVADRYVSVDPGRLQGLFENLFRNAIEHGREDISLWVEHCDGGFVVADDGPGIPEEKRDQVFEHGYTGGGGTGLGLAKVESIAVAHDWDVTVEESREGGACFRFQNVEFL